MAEEASGSRRGALYFDRLTGGIRRDADRLTVSPETYPSLWYDLKNLIPYKGRLQRREGVIAPSTAPAPPGGVAAGDWPILITSVLLLDNQDRFILVTTRDIWIGNSGGLDGVIWSNVTPVYNTGVVTVTDTSASITGVGTAWVDRRIMPGQPIKLDGVWYTLATVTSNTAATLTTPYSGASSPPDVAYEIRRTFSGSVLRPFAAARVLNGDLYVVIRDGGYYQNPATSAIVGGTAIVLKVDRVADTAKTSFTAADTTILASTDEMDVGTGTWAERVIPKGFEFLEDGRIVIAAHAINKTGATPAYWANNKILFSSHTDLAEWAFTPAGFYFLNGGRGGITAMLRMGGSLAVHFNDQVQLGQITGADNDPIAWRTTRAHVGAAGPRLALDVPPSPATRAGHFFLAGDMHTYVFDGDQSVPVDTGWGALIRDEDPVAVDVAAVEGHLSIDEYRRSVSLFCSASGFVSQAGRELRYDLDTGVTHRHLWKTFISACSTRRMFGPSSAAGLAHDSRILGVRGTDSAGAATKYMYRAALETLNDADLPLVLNGQTTGGFRAESHDLALWPIDQEGRILRIIVWFHGRDAATETLLCSQSVDSGVTWEAGVGSASPTLANTAQERRMTFYFSTKPPADRARIRLEANDPDVFSFALTRLLIDYVAVSNARAL